MNDRNAAHVPTYVGGGVPVERVRRGAVVVLDLEDGTTATVERVTVRHDAYGAEWYSLTFDGGRVSQDIERGRIVFTAERGA